MEPSLVWDIAKYVLSGVTVVMGYFLKSQDSQIKALWRKVDALQAEETNRKVDFGVLNVQVTTLNGDMAVIKTELQKVSIQMTKLDTVIEMLEKK